MLSEPIEGGASRVGAPDTITGKPLWKSFPRSRYNGRRLPQEPHVTLVAGARLGKYTIIGPLGSGGMGTVYRARDEKLRREIAIKVLGDAVTDCRKRLLVLPARLAPSPR